MHAHARVGDVGTGHYILIHEVHVKLIYDIYVIYYKNKNISKMVHFQDF